MVYKSNEYNRKQSGDYTQDFGDRIIKQDQSKLKTLKLGQKRNKHFNYFKTFWTRYAHILDIPKNYLIFFNLESLGKIKFHLFGE